MTYSKLLNLNRIVQKERLFFSHTHKQKRVLVVYIVIYRFRVVKKITDSFLFYKQLK
jgi:hypothetical protein